MRAQKACSGLIFLLGFTGVGLMTLLPGGSAHPSALASQVSSFVSDQEEAQVGSADEEVAPRGSASERRRLASLDNAGLLGSFTVMDGPDKSTEPNTYSCLEACELIFGNVTSAGFVSYAGSTSSSEITYTCYGDYRDNGCGTGAVNQSLETGPRYIFGEAFSVYVKDHDCPFINYCWQIFPPPPPCPPSPPLSPPPPPSPSPLHPEPTSPTLTARPTLHPCPPKPFTSASPSPLRHFPTKPAPSPPPTVSTSPLSRLRLSLPPPPSPRRHLPHPFASSTPSPPNATLGPSSSALSPTLPTSSAPPPPPARPPPPPLTASTSTTAPGPHSVGGVLRWVVTIPSLAVCLSYQVHLDVDQHRQLPASDLPLSSGCTVFRGSRGICVVWRSRGVLQQQRGLIGGNEQYSRGNLKGCLESAYLWERQLSDYELEQIVGGPEYEYIFLDMQLLRYWEMEEAKVWNINAGGLYVRDALAPDNFDRAGRLVNAPSWRYYESLWMSHPGWRPHEFGRPTLPPPSTPPPSLALYAARIHPASPPPLPPRAALPLALHPPLPPPACAPTPPPSPPPPFPLGSSKATPITTSITTISATNA
ncbi:hypothetical protein CYMTET_15708 [Cymbomonas tetramitiformis]|uniref:Uncharacterized protein n=1 Tax=Cymbomonas tetramitiformis TaxID=36881 RepID=A0AAE0GDP0_9CHLO|nr:hypothetical protein CYMTET_15708 [Cymbomonas tetramitiformis]